MAQFGTDANSAIRRGAVGVGLRNVGSYQVSGQPFLTGSLNLDVGKIHMVEFPFVTKRIQVTNVSPGSQFIMVMFNSGSGTTEITVPGAPGEQNFTNTRDTFTNFNYVPVTGSATLDMNVKCKKIYIANLSNEARFAGVNADNAAYAVFAELTNIPSERMYHLTGSGIDD